MSDTMLFGVLRMPYELAMSSELSRVQFYGRAQEAANLIESQAAELELRRKSGTASDRLHNLCEGIAADADGSEWSREEWERIDAETVRLKNEIESQSAELARITAERDAAKAAYEITRQDCWNLTEKVIPNLRAENDALRAALADLLDAHARNVLYNGAGHWDAARAAMNPQETTCS